MKKPSTRSRSGSDDNGWLSRDRVLALALTIATAIVFYLCYRVTSPFLPALAWALALAVVTHPLYRWLQKRLNKATPAAVLSVTIVVTAVMLPVVVVTHNLVLQATNHAQVVQQEFASQQWRSVFDRHPRLKQLEKWIDSQLGLTRSEEALSPTGGSATSASTGPTKEDQVGTVRASEDQQQRRAFTEEKAVRDEKGTSDQLQQTAEPNQRESSHSAIVGTESQTAFPLQNIAGELTQGVGTAISGVLWLAMQMFITVMALFYFFRDRERILKVVRSMMPLSESETDKVFARVDDTIHATIYGSLAVALVQGCMGGLIFWLLGLPSPLFWGSVMGLLAVVPVLGTFVVWAPTAVYLVLHGDWAKAIVLVAWGGLAIGLVDNLLYPFLVGKRLRFHTLLTFLAIVGGLALFGASGVILGPLLLAIADALLDVWKRRTALGRTVEEGFDTPP